jgi:hypothetical protein
VWSPFRKKPILDLVPLESLGPIRFGMTRQEVREAMLDEPETFEKGEGGPEIDGYFDLALQVHFRGEDERVCFVEAAADAAFRVRFQGKFPLEVKADEAIRLLRSQAPFDADDPELGYGFVFPALETSLWREVMPEHPADEEGQRFSSIAAGEMGYFSERTG